MGSLRQAFGFSASIALLSALLLFAPSPARAGGDFDGPIPTEAAKIAAWVKQWPVWKQERQRLDQELLRLQERLRQQGEAEANSSRPSWWDLPARQSQASRLRYLQALRLDLERAQERRFQVQAVETLWKTDLEARQAKGALPDSLAAVLKELQEQAEKDLKNKEESQ
jgi:hypothetical protein